MHLSRRDCLGLLGAGAALAASASGEEISREERMKWWHDAKFGMFIHWGLYSVLGRHEWAMEEEGIPVAEYQKLAKRFTPQSQRRARLGAAGQTGRPEVHGDDHQTPRGLLPVRHEATRTTARRSRPAGATW